MSTETKKEGEFNTDSILEIRDKLDCHNLGLRALSALLESSDLDGFSESDYREGYKVEAANLRGGLAQIIENHIVHQDKIVSEYCDQYIKSDICFVQDAENGIDAIKGDVFRGAVAVEEHLRKKIAKLDIVINRGGALKDRAVGLKESCLLYIAQFKGKEVSSGCARG